MISERASRVGATQQRATPNPDLPFFDVSTRKKEFIHEKCLILRAATLREANKLLLGAPVDGLDELENYDNAAVISLRSTDYPDYDRATSSLQPNSGVLPVYIVNDLRVEAQGAGGQESGDLPGFDGLSRVGGVHTTTNTPYQSLFNHDLQRLDPF
ncbi:hypothetical protein [Streptomyces sp. NPDC058595]|uniref:hypothetical protein n=1 Tax=Streptomyces sp. NPDC058595 TaxID=3346550 RepID=UPI00366891BC